MDERQRIAAALSLTKHEGLPVHGYQAQSSDAVNLVNENKLIEERLLRKMDELWNAQSCDARWLEEARVHLEIGFMALNRAIFQPQRVKLPEDNA